MKLADGGLPLRCTAVGDFGVQQVAVSNIKHIRCAQIGSFWLCAPATNKNEDALDGCPLPPARRAVGSP